MNLSEILNNFSIDSLGNLIDLLFGMPEQISDESDTAKAVSILISHCVIPNTPNIPEILNIKPLEISTPTNIYLDRLIEKFHIPYSKGVSSMHLLYNDTMMILILISPKYTIEHANLLPSYVKMPGLIWLMTYSPTHRAKALDMLGHAISQPGGVQSLLQNFARGDDIDRLKVLATKALVNPPGSVDKSKYSSSVIEQIFTIFGSARTDKYTLSILADSLNGLLYKFGNDVSHQLDLFVMKEGEKDKMIEILVELMMSKPPHKTILCVLNSHLFLFLSLYRLVMPSLAIKSTLLSLLKRMFIYCEDVSSLILEYIRNSKETVSVSLLDSGEISMEYIEECEIQTEKPLESICEVISESAKEPLCKDFLAKFFVYLLGEYTKSPSFEVNFLILHICSTADPCSLLVSPIHTKQFLALVLDSSDLQLVQLGLSVLLISVSDCEASSEDKKFLIELTPKLTKLKASLELRTIIKPIENKISDILLGIRNLEEQKLDDANSELPFEIAYTLIKRSEDIRNKLEELNWDIFDRAISTGDGFVFNNLVIAYQHISAEYLHEAIHHLISIYQPENCSVYLETLFQVILSAKSRILPFIADISEFLDRIILSEKDEKALSGAFMIFSALCKHIKGDLHKYLVTLIPYISEKVHQYCSDLYMNKPEHIDISPYLHLLYKLLKYSEPDHIEAYHEQVKKMTEILMLYQHQSHIQVHINNISNIFTTLNSKQYLKYK